MSVTVERERLTFGRVQLTRRPHRPVQWFAATGLIFVGFQAYVYGRWLLSGPAATATGDDPVPSWMRTTIWIFIVVNAILCAAALWWFVVRPLVRQRRLPLSGLLVLAAPTACWQELLSNYFNHIYTYNAAFPNAGSWYEFIPGWSSPNGGRLVAPIFFSAPLFITAWAVPALAIAALLRRSKARWPGLSRGGIVTLCLVLAAIFDVLVEPAFVRLGLYSFAGTIPSLTLWRGHYYQFPMYAPFFMALFYGLPALLVYFLNDRGLTIAERGVEQLGVAGPRRTWWRFFALAGALNLFWLLYNVAFMLISMMPTFAWAGDIVENRSYLRDGVCGPPTTYACPAGDIPIPRRGGIHIDPAGNVVRPAQ